MESSNHTKRHINVCPGNDLCFLFFNNFSETHCIKGWFGCKDFSRQGSVYWEGGVSSPPQKKVFPEKKFKAISNTDLL